MSEAIFLLPNRENSGVLRANTPESPGCSSVNAWGRRTDRLRVFLNNLHLVPPLVILVRGQAHWQVGYIQGGPVWI